MFINDHRGRLDLERFGIRVQPAKFDSPRAGDGGRGRRGFGGWWEVRGGGGEGSVKSGGVQGRWGGGGWGCGLGAM